MFKDIWNQILVQLNFESCPPPAGIQLNFSFRGTWHPWFQTAHILHMFPQLHCDMCFVFHIAHTDRVHTAAGFWLFSISGLGAHDSQCSNRAHVFLQFHNAMHRVFHIVHTDRVAAGFHVSPTGRGSSGFPPFSFLLFQITTAELPSWRSRHHTFQVDQMSLPSRNIDPIFMSYLYSKVMDLLLLRWEILTLHL